MKKNRQTAIPMHRDLEFALDEGTDAEIRDAIDAAVDLNAVDSIGMTALMRVSPIRLAKRILNAGADIDFVHDGRTALSWAVHFVHTNTVKFLLEAGADINLLGATPIYATQAESDGKHLKLLDLLIDHGLRKTPKWNQIAADMLRCAANDSSLKRVMRMIDEGALFATEADYFNELNGSLCIKSPTLTLALLDDRIAKQLSAASLEALLGEAATEGNTRVVSRLMDFTMNLDCRFDTYLGDFGVVKSVTPLIAAVAKGNLEIVKILLKNGADPAVRDARSDSARTWATKLPKSESKKIIALLAGR